MRSRLIPRKAAVGCVGKGAVEYVGRRRTACYSRRCAALAVARIGEESSNVEGCTTGTAATRGGHHQEELSEHRRGEESIAQPTQLPVLHSYMASGKQRDVSATANYPCHSLLLLEELGLIAETPLSTITLSDSQLFNSTRLENSSTVHGLYLWTSARQMSMSGQKQQNVRSKMPSSIPWHSLI